MNCEKPVRGLLEVAYFINIRAALLLAFAWGALLISKVPLADVIEFGHDEGYELMKASLCSNGFSLYSDIWNDQPPLHTLTLATIFRLFGPSIFLARLLSVGCSAAIIAFLYALVKRSSGAFAATIAVILLALSPHFIELSVSCMLSVPSMMMMLAAPTFLLCCNSRAGYPSLFISGLLSGMAIQTKLTALLIMPSLIFVVIWCNKYNIKTNVWRRVVLFCATTSFAVFAIGMLFGEIPSTLVGTHVLAHIQSMPGSDYRFWKAALQQWPAGLIAVVGIWHAVRSRGSWMLFPVVFLFSVLIAHLTWRPLWYYYYLHVAVPLAWLSGIGLSKLLNAYIELPAVDNRQSLWRRTRAGGVFLIASSLLISMIAPSIRTIAASFGAYQRISDEPTLAKLARHRDGNGWIFTDRVIYAFHAGLLTPPRISIMPEKRRTACDTFEADIKKELIEYQPSVVLLHGPVERQPWLKEYLNNRYDQVERLPSMTVYKIRNKKAVNEVNMHE